MYGSWIEHVLTSIVEKFLGIISDIENVLMIYNYWVWG